MPNRFSQGMSGPAAIDALNQLGNDVDAVTGGGSSLDNITNQQAVKALTGTTGLTVGDILYASGTNIMSRLSTIGAGNVLLSNGPTAAPSYGKVGLTTHVSGILPAANGGTGKSSYAQYSILYAPTATTVGEIVAGSVKTVLTGTGAAPAFAVLDMTFMPSTWVKHRVRCASTAAYTVSANSQTLTNSGTLAALTMDGVTPALGDYVLIKNQASAAQNGIYELTTLGTASVAWVLTRPEFADSSSDIAASMVAVSSGTTNGGEIFTTKFKSTETIGTNSMNWSTLGSGGGGGAGSFTSMTVTGAADFGGTTTLANASVNYVSVTGAATSAAPTLSFTGGDTNVGGIIATKGNGTLLIQTNGSTQVELGDTNVSVNYLKMYGGGAGSGAKIVAKGADTDVQITYSSKGVYGHVFYTGNIGPIQFSITHTVNAVNRFSVTGAAAGAAPAMVATGSDTNIDLRFTPKGTGLLSTTGLKIDEGTNKKMGVTAAMTAGSITVNTTAVTANSRIFLTAQTTGGTAGALRVSARTAGTSFTITSTSGSDTSTVAWFIVEPA